MQVVFSPYFLFCIELNALKKSANNSVALRFFAHTSLMI